MKISVGIIGVTGYTGQELLRILLRHPNVQLRYLSARTLKSPTPVGELIPAFRGMSRLSVHPFQAEEAIRLCDLLFLCLPHGVAMELAPRLFRRKPALRVIDLSGDFRLQSAKDYHQAYHLRHRSPAFLRRAVYGLSEWERPALALAHLVANPGCYATAALLAAAPLARTGLLDPKGLIVDAKSGVTGAGRSAKEELLFSEVNEDLRAYRVNVHQQMPEIEQGLHRVGRKGAVTILFVPHLVPLNRGIYATLYAPLVRRVKEPQLREIYRRQYGKEPFIRLLPEGVWPQVKSVAGTNFCEIGLRMDPDGRRVIILSAIDNLGKGASGQAVQNMNLICGFPETEGLVEVRSC